MSLQRNSLLDLLPGVREGLHSAILTTYSFDYYFFEKVLLRRLRSVGVRNVVVLVDATMLHESTQHSSNYVASRSKSYNLVPVDCGGAFHPKMLLLLGEKSGWLAIGSGNLTESGHGKNDEIWGAFYYSKSEPGHQNLFAGAWNFTLTLGNSHLTGYAKKQLADAEQYTPWLGELPSYIPGEWSKTVDGTGIMLIHSAGASTVWEQLTQNLPGNQVERITVFSPFFDNQGFALLRLSEGFPSAEFRVVTEPVWGQLPLNLPERAHNQIQFFDWITLAGGSSESKYRWLHAKIIVFETNSVGNYCFMGSSNATPAGLGLGGSNHEANLLLYNPEVDFLEALGLSLTADMAVELSSLTSNRPSAILDSHKGIVFETIISAAELDESDIQIFVTKPLAITVRLVLFDTEGLEIQSVETTFEKSGPATFRFRGNKPPCTCQIFDLNTGLPRSNRQIIVSLSELRKTNPDPVRAKWEAQLDRLRDGENQALANILPLLDLEAPESPETHRERGMRIAIESDESSTSTPPVDVDLSEAEFTRIPDEHIYRSQTLRHDPARDLSNFLMQIGFDDPDAEDEIDTDEDEELIDAESGERKDWVAVSLQKKKKPDTTDKEAASFKAFLGRYRKVLASAVGSYLKKTKTNRPTQSLTSRDLSHFLIALRLMIRYGDRKPKDSPPHAFPVFPLHHGRTHTWEPKKIESAQIACYEIIGKMLLLMNKGLPTAQTKREESRIMEMKNTIFIDALFLFIVALNEKLDEEYIPLLYYNLLLHFPESRQIDIASLREQLELRGKFGTGISKKTLSRAVADFQNHLRYFENHFENKDLNQRHRITIENQRYYLLEKLFGVSLVETDDFDPRYHPAGDFDGESEYYLNFEIKKSKPKFYETRP